MVVAMCLNEPGPVKPVRKNEDVSKRKRKIEGKGKGKNSNMTTKPAKQK